MAKYFYEEKYLAYNKQVREFDQIKESALILIEKGYFPKFCSEWHLEYSAEETYKLIELLKTKI